MVNAPKPALQAGEFEAAEPDKRFSHLRLVKADAYADWDSAYLDNVGRLYRLIYSRVGNRRSASRSRRR